MLCDGDVYRPAIGEVYSDNCCAILGVIVACDANYKALIHGRAARGRDAYPLVEPLDAPVVLRGEVDEVVATIGRKCSIRIAMKGDAYVDRCLFPITSEEHEEGRYEEYA